MMQTATQTATYKFLRSESLNGFLSRNQLSTDAQQALQSWCNYPGRSFKTVGREGKELVAKLRFDKHDTFASLHLESECEEFGVYKTYLGS